MLGKLFFFLTTRAKRIEHFWESWGRKGKDAFTSENGVEADRSVLLTGVGSELISFAWVMYLGYTLWNTDGDGMG